MPVPVNAAIWVEPFALSATEILALKAAAACGVNVTEISQLELTNSVDPQVLA
jgi:hypothetical protein